MFQTLREPPKKGSLRESVLLLFVLKTEEIGYLRDLASAQIQIDKAEGLKKFNDYRQKMFPWVEVAKERDQNAHMKTLMDELKRGALIVKPMNTMNTKSRLVTRTTSVAIPDEQRKGMNDFYKRLGKTLPI